MRLWLVGVRDNRRVIHWRGVIVTTFIVASLSAAGYCAAQLVFELVGGAPPLLPGLIIAAILPVGCVVGVQVRRAWKLPVDQLPQVR
jgi:hypothetical protein